MTSRRHVRTEREVQPPGERSRRRADGIAAALGKGPHRAVNAELRLLLGDGERAVRADRMLEAREAFLEAGQCAAGLQLWRTALRCYRRSLELDLADPEPVTRVLRMPWRILLHGEWREYAHALERRAWSSFGCRTAQVVTGGSGAHVECPGVGAVMELMMTEDDLVETRPAARFAGMPLAMALIVLRRAMWLAPRELASDPGSLRVAFEGRTLVRLDEHGDWELIGAGGARRR